MATELQNTIDTVEPSTFAAPRQSWVARFENRLSKLPFGRHALGCMQWCVVAALVLSGFYGAEAINSGVELAMRDGGAQTSPQLIVAAASPTPAK